MYKSYKTKLNILQQIRDKRRSRPYLKMKVVPGMIMVNKDTERVYYCVSGPARERNVPGKVMFVNLNDNAYIPRTLLPDGIDDSLQNEDYWVDPMKFDIFWM